MPTDIRSLPVIDFVGRSGDHDALGLAPRKSSKIDLLMRLPGALRISDWLGTAALGILINSDFTRSDRPLTQALGVILAATMVVNYLHFARAYSIRSVLRLPVQLISVSLAWTGAYLSLLTISYGLDRSEEFFADWAILWFSATWLYLAGTRCGAALRLSRWQRQGRLVRNIAVLGTGPAALALAQRLRANPDEANVIGVFIDGRVPPGTGGVAGDGDLLASLANAGQVDEVVLALARPSPAVLNRTIARFCASQVEVRLALGISATGYPPGALRLTSGIPTLTLQRRPLSGWGAPLKRTEDILLALLLLVALAPLIMIIALLIKVDSRGPVFFRQERYGFNNQRIVVYKFRSMVHEAHPDSSVPQARRNDPRVTRLGAVLRRTSLDELPQLFNVLAGDMSLIGPRPHATAHNEKYAQVINGYLGRHRMKPGITGWAQVNGCRGETKAVGQMRQRLELDLYYIANWSLLLDLRILLATIPVVICGTNAY
jgi:putative colanic acid biosynthesis UDP-glucose lipid carrier transferase